VIHVNTDDCRFESDPLPDALARYAAGAIASWEFEDALLETHAHVPMAPPTSAQMARVVDGSFEVRPNEPIPLAPFEMPDGRLGVGILSCAEFKRLADAAGAPPHMSSNVPDLLAGIGDLAVMLNPGTASALLLEPEYVASILQHAGGKGQERVGQSNPLAIARSLGQLGELGRELVARHRRREYRASCSDSMHNDLSLAAAQGYNLLEWWRTSRAWPAELADLIDQAKDHCARGLEAALAGDELLATITGRLLMEIEFLIMDFAFDPARVVEWTDSEPHVRAKRFSFAETRKRLEKAKDIPAGYSLPDRAEYQSHSLGAHPSPRAAVTTPPDWTLEFFFSVGDLLGHLARVLDAIRILAEVLELKPLSDALDEPSDGQLRGALEQINAMTAKRGVKERPPHIPIKWNVGTDGDSAPFGLDPPTP
jgi:hypothetical protein